MRQYIYLFLMLMALSCSKDEISNTDTANGNTGGNENNIIENQQPTGSSANDFLSANTFTKLTIELVYVEGFELNTESENMLIEFLTERLHKPEGISITKRAVTSPADSSLDIQEIIEIEDDHRTLYNNGDELALWIYLSDGESAANSNGGTVLGTAYRNTSFVLFQESIENLSNSPIEPDRTVLESTVLLHEMGHLLGLTNLGSPMQTDHEDDTHPKHCNNSDCLMYWSAETNSGIENLMGMQAPPELDLQCIADLQANGGK